MKKIISLAFILGLSSSVLFAQNTLNSKTTKDKLFPAQNTTEVNTASQKQQPATKTMPSFLNQGVDYSNSKPKKTETKVETKQQNVSADTTPNKDKTSYYSVERNQGSLYIKFTAQSPITAGDMFSKMRNVFRISQNDSIGFVKNSKDKIGYTHYQYQQFYKGIEVMGGQFLLHEKNSKLTSANGHFYPGISLTTSAIITPQAAIEFAKNFMGAKKYMWEIPEEEQFLKREKNDSNATYYPKPSLIIAAKNGVYNKENFRLCYKITIASSEPYQIYDYYIDANTGELVNKITKINDGCFHPDKKKESQNEKEEIKNKALNSEEPINNLETSLGFSENFIQNRNQSPTSDVTSTANTFYSGTKTITTDSYNGSYRLRETARPIQTFNMKNGVNYANAVDFTNSTTSWTTQEITLDSVKINYVNNNWQDYPGEQLSNGGKPDLFIKIFDASNRLIWGGVNAIFNNTLPPVNINTLKISLYNGPFTLYVFDQDGSILDTLGIFNFNAITGTLNNLINNGTSVSIYKSARNNPALDVHWGVESIYDYYLTNFNRNSFDNNGSIIKSYVHFDIGYANAFWNGQVLSLGDGDAVETGPRAYLNVIGHEFTHGVVQYSANLAYQGESGALNESFSDIFGTALEFYKKPSTANWLHGEEASIIPGGFIRSLQNPKLRQQPDTYESPSQNGYWQNPNEPYDYGGVHINSGVQNYWFYLLSQGGSGTNDLGNTYSVTGIGISDASKIAYYNLTTQLTDNSTYYDSYQRSLIVAEALFGNPSNQYSAVQNAWYAVGIGNNPTTYCSGTTNLTAPSGTITDGSGSANYNNNSACAWVIAPPAATRITLNFTSFSTEAGYDSVFVYDGPNQNSTLIGAFTGNTIPSSISTSVGTGAMCIVFKSDDTFTDQGWSANYSSVGGTPTCNGYNLLANTSGTLNDGSGASNYGNNQTCVWHIAPPCATSLTLTFTQFATESGFDSVTIYDGSFTRLNSYSGTTIPPSITTNTGEFYIVFKSDYSINLQGWTANYSSNSTASGDCSGNKTTPSTTTLNTSDYGSITDGSGANNYCNNRDCRWLIQPPQATSVKLTFLSFDVEDASTDGNSIYDAVEIYDGATTSATLLGRFTGNTIPAEITSSTGSLLVRFFTDNSVEKTGWSAFYTSTSPSICNPTTTLTTTTGTISDGSGANQYANNSDCSWLIQPANASKVTLCFSDFNTELNYDGVIIYDGPNTNSTVLAVYTGTTLPASVTSTGGSMLVRFVSDEALRYNGWTANYTSTPIITANFPLITCQGSGLVLSSSSPSNNQWYLNSSAVSNANSNTFIPIISGIYTVSTSLNGCASNPSTPVTVTINQPPTAGITNNTGSTVLTCSRTSISATATGGVSYSWSGGLGNNANASITSPGTYTVTVTGSNGCTSTSSITVTSNTTTPTAGITNNTGTTVLTCNSTSISVTATGGATYSWSGGLGNNANASITSPGTYTVTVTGSNGCISISSINVTSNTTPPTSGITNNSGSTELNCNRTSINVIATGGISYSWSGGLGNNATATITTPGTYTVTTTGSNGCTSTSNITVTSNTTTPTASITNNSGTTELNCINTSISITATGGTTYSWSGGLGNNANATISAPGTYTVTVTGANGCSSTSSITITSNITAPATPSISWNGSQFSTTATGVTYQWYLNGNAIPGATSATFTPDSIGVYKVMVTSNGCSSSSDNYTLVVTGIDPTLTLSPFDAQVYPNPTKNDFVIKFGETPDMTLDIQLINNLGIVLKTIKTRSNLTTVKVNGLPSGIYFVKIIGGLYNQVKKIEVIN
jgi:Zn-dependent metalloprotease